MPTKEKVRIEYISLEKLKRWPRNAKDHDLGSLHQSFSRFGYVAPILIDERSKKIVAGHGRLDSLLLMKDDGQKPPERIILKNGSWFVPVIRGVRFSSDREAEGYLLADNRQTEIGGWHENILAEVLSEFAKEDSLDGLGWDADDVDEIIKGIQAEPREAPEAQIDKADELQKKWKVKLGQVWSIGSHKLMCGDAEKDVEKLLDGNKFDLALADPPWNLNYFGDDNPWDKYACWLKEIKILCESKAKSVFIFQSSKAVPYVAYLFKEWTMFCNPKSFCQLIKGQMSNAFDVAFLNNNKLNFTGKSGWRNYHIANNSSSKNACRGLGHPTPRPIDTIEYIIGMFSHETILDPFLGSGTTMVAAEQLNRICYGMEIEPKYCAVTLERMSDMGLKPKLIS